MDERIERIAFNEDLFRKVNEQARALHDEPRDRGERLTILCECGNDSCVDRISLPAAEYEQVRADVTHFAVVPGHELPDVETVVRRANGYLVVEKREGDAARLVEELAARP